MELQPLGRGEPAMLCLYFVGVEALVDIENDLHFPGERLCQIHKAPPGMGGAMSQDGLKLLW
jgi:hypothetical protein